jgi:hypothetical protein
MMLPLGYTTLTLAICAILIYFGFTTIDKSFEKEKRGKKKLLIVAGLIGFQLYIYLISISGFIQSFEFPPRFALTMILPAFIFTGIFVYRNRNKAWLHNLPTRQLFFFQSFRVLVESLFVGAVTAGLLHKEVTIEGYNYDMVYAFTVLIIGFIAFRGKSANLKLVLQWNYLGLTVIASIIFLFLTSIYTPELYGATAPMMPIEGITYPYVLIAGFLMPSAVFVHVLSIAQLRRLIK